MDKQLYGIIKAAYKKYGKEHRLTIASVQMLYPFIKSAEDYPEINEVLEQSLEVNIDELISLFHPEKYDFQTQNIGDIGVEK